MEKCKNLLIIIKFYYTLENCRKSKIRHEYITQE
jgi:hypothetical protein